MTKIAFVTPHYYPSKMSGSGVVVAALAEEFASCGYDVSVITSNALTTRYWYDPIFGKKISNKFDTIRNVKIYRLNCNQILSSLYFIIVKYFGRFLSESTLERLKILQNGPFLVGLHEILEDKKFDIVHCSPFPLYINKQVADYVRKAKNKPKLIFTPFFHSQNKDFSNSQLQEIFNEADIIHVISESERNEICATFNLNKEKIKVISLFLDITQMHTPKDLSAEVETFKKKYGLKGKKIIMFAGIKGAGKGAIDLLKAIDILHKSSEKFILLAIGGNTPEWDSAKKKINKRCLLDFDYKQGREKEVIFASADIFCMPSKNETFGLVYLEAWHKRKPIIAANIPAVKELVGDAGLFTEYGNVQNIIENIKKLSYDTALVEKLGDRGYNKLMSNFIFSHVFQKYNKLLKTLSTKNQVS